MNSSVNLQSFFIKCWPVAAAGARQCFPYVRVQQSVATGVSVGALTVATTVHLSHKKNCVGVCFWPTLTY